MNYHKNNISIYLTSANACVMFVFILIIFIVGTTTNIFAQGYLEYQSKEGDSLWTIAHQFQLSIQEVAQVNNLEQDEQLNPGQLIKIPKNEMDSSSSSITGPNITDTVQRDESLWDIALQYRLSLEHISSDNDLNKTDSLKEEQPGISLKDLSQTIDTKNYERISISQIIKNLPNSRSGNKKNEKPDISATDLAVEQKSDTDLSVTPSERLKDVIHFVQKGETLWQISRKYQVSVQSIIVANQISDSRRLIVGQRLKIPNTRNSSISSRSFIWPLDGFITSQFGIRTLKGRRDYHTGIDIDAQMGALVKAAESGKVSFSGYINGYGNVVIIEHDGGFSTVYAHSASNLVKEGQNVTKGNIICKLGSTGNATGSHLHFEIRENGRPVNPLNYLP